MCSPLETVIAACESKGLKVTYSANWHRCPHPCSPEGDEKKRSFAFRETPDGSVIPASHKAYTIRESVEALGLKMSDLFPPSDHRYTKDGRMVYGYEYTDQNGRPVGRVTRTRDKEFLQGAYDQQGNYEPKLNGKKLPLYMLPLVVLWIAEGTTIYLTEGEKDARVLIRAGFGATSKPGGAGCGWHDSQVESLTSADVVIVADKDDAGYKAAKVAYETLLPFAKSVKIVEAKDGKDTADHFAAGFSVADFVPRDDLVPLISSSGKEVKCLEPSELDEEPIAAGVPTGFKTIDAATESKGLPRGQEAVFGARKKVGKTSGMTQIACHACETGHRVLYVTLADLKPFQVWRRMRRQMTGWSDAPYDLMKADAWREKVGNMIKFWDLHFADRKMLGSHYIEDVAPGILALHGKHRFDLVVIDYAQKLDSRREKDRVRAMERCSSDLANLAEDCGFALLVGSQLTDGGQTRYSQEFEDDCGLFIRVSAPDGLESPARDVEIPYNRFGPSFSFKAYWQPSTLTIKEAE